MAVARRADDVVLEVAHSVERIDQFAERAGIERECHGVDREVTPELVVFDRSVLDDRFARVGPVGLLACPDELYFPSVTAQHRRAEVLVHRNFGFQFPSVCFGHFDAASHHHDVDIGAGTVQEMVAAVPSKKRGAQGVVLN